MADDLGGIAAGLATVPAATPSRAQPLVVLRLLGGALRGGEFALAAGTTLVVASAASAQQAETRLSDFPENALYVPAGPDGLNFEIDVVPQAGLPPRVVLRVQHADGALAYPAAPEADYAWHSVRSIGGLEFAMRAFDDVWPEHVLHYTGPVGDKVAVAVASGTAGGTAATGRATAIVQAFRRRRRWIVAIAITIAMAVFVAVALSAASDSARGWTDAWRDNVVGAIGMPTAAEPKIQARDALQQSRRIQRKKGAAYQARMAQLLTGLVGEYTVLPGSDGLFYLFVQDTRDAGWARQALARSGDSADIRVVQRGDERQRVQLLLDRTEAALAYHVLRLDDPAHPVLLLSNERSTLDRDGRDALASRLAARLPYALTARIESVSDSCVAELAEAGLERLGISHRRQLHDSSVTMAMSNGVGDGELQKVRSFIDSFYLQWGARYVHFSVEMKEDGRKGKSFGYGGGGYMKKTPSHWDFSA